MVWAFVPADSSQGSVTYYLFSSGTYKIGRKDCDVVVPSDKGVSRVHAEVIVEWDPSNKKESGLSKVFLKDLSKFGTFVNKENSSLPIFSLPDKKVQLKDGDLVSLGMGNSTFRFCFIPLVILLHQPKGSKVSHPLLDLVLFIGARAIHKWNSECTHVIVDDLIPVTDDIIEAIVAQKYVVLSDWVKDVAEKKVSTEILNFSQYAPTLKIGGGEFTTSVKLVETKVRENCLSDYTFVLGSPEMYKFGKKLKKLVEAVGAKVLSVDSFNSSSKVGDDEAKRTVLVIPVASGDVFDQSRQLKALARVNDIDLLSAVLSGQLDESVIIQPSIVVSSSHSTDETVGADSDLEIDTVTSHGHKGIAALEVLEEDNREAAPVIEARDMVERRDRGDEAQILKHENSDIVFSQDLLVRANVQPTTIRSKMKEIVVNFKQFKKRETRSGNSFKDLIPFSKEPYTEREGQIEHEKFVIEERKRKQAEAVAEDLFNSEKIKRQKGVIGSSIQELATGRLGMKVSR